MKRYSVWLNCAGGLCERLLSEQAISISGPYKLLSLDF
jgi:hypothetical protein